MQLGKREKILAVVFGTFLFLWITEKVFLAPFADKSEMISSETDAIERKFRKLLSISMEEDNIQTTFNQIKPYVEISETEEGALSAIMKKVEEISKGCNITLLTMKPDTEPVETTEYYIVKKTELDIEGSQDNIIKFLYILENSKYPLTVTRLDFKIKDRDKSLMEAELVVHFLYFL